MLSRAEPVRRRKIGHQSNTPIIGVQNMSSFFLYTTRDRSIIDFERQKIIASPVEQLLILFFFKLSENGIGLNLNHSTIPQQHHDHELGKYETRAGEHRKITIEHSRNNRLLI